MAFSRIDAALGWSAPSQDPPAQKRAEQEKDALSVDPKMALLLAGLLSGSGIVAAHLLGPYLEKYRRRKRRERILDAVIERAEQAKMARLTPTRRLQKLADALRE